MDSLVSAEAPVFGKLHTHNHLLGDQAALARAWDEDGYWFFRDVLDTKVIAQLRQTYVEYLVELGLTDPGDTEVRYNGTDYSKIPINMPNSLLNQRKVHKLLHEAPTINAFFTKLFGCDPFWVPFSVHRSNPPINKPRASRFDYIHEDGISNPGLDFIICWVPLDDIDEDVGGVAVVEDAHKGPCLHRTEGMNILPIRAEDLPPNAWRRADYRAGDVLLMSRRTVHSGVVNISKDRFRFSIDTRILPSSSPNLPVVGTLTQVEEGSVSVRDANGEHRLRFDEASYVRGYVGDQMTIADVPNRYKPGDAVIAAVEDGVIRNMRPQG